MDLANVLTPAGLTALAGMIQIDLTKIGDDVMIMNTIASGLLACEWRKVIMLGVGIAMVVLLDKMKDTKSEEDFFAGMSQ